MYSKFLKYIRNEQLFEKTDKLLIGVSGGVDSVVLTEFINQLGNEFALAHCNFNLRGADSNADEQFVRDLADQLGVKAFFSSFQTRDYAGEKGISIEMAARELRYEWFENIRAAKAYDYILVAHHLDDVLETFILNLSRGTGIRGLSGIKNKAGMVLRPLLFASREEIEAYARENNLAWRTDESNKDVTIKRNKVRHQVLPLMEELNPAFKRNFENTIHYLNETESVFLQQIETVKDQLVYEEDGWVKVNKSRLQLLNPLSTYLFEILRDYNFNSDVVEEIIEGLSGESGSRYFSSTHRLVIDREDLIINKIEQQQNEVFYIDKTQKFIQEPIPMRISVERYNNEYRIPNSKDIAVFDYDKIHFPFMLRRWNQGEYFKPLGMEGYKKLSDFFIDEKMSIPEKENAWILSSENKVVWIIGRRIDDRFKLTNETKLVLRIELVNA